MRRLLALPFALALLMTPLVSACGGDDDDGDDVTDDGDDVTDDGDDGDDVTDDGDDGPGACGDIEGACIELSPVEGGDQEQLQTALQDVEPGDVIFLHAGVYELDLALSLDIPGVTIRGEGEAASILSFAGQLDGAQGLLVTADDFTAEDFAVEDTAGDGIKVEGGSRIVFRGVRAEWTGEPSAENGAYGLYPVQCTDVLIEDSIVRGASDAGIYVGQTERAVVRRNLVENNVAGIEVENTFDADVYENTATANTGGILVFNLPGLQVENGARTRVFDNDISENNGDNFAPPGNIVALIPPGTGFVALAAHDVEVFDNTFTDNMTVQLGIISYQITLNEFEDEGYIPWSDTLYFHDNTFVGGGDMPSGLLGGLIAAAIDPLKLEVVPDIVVDGNYDPAKVDEKTGDLLPEFAICVDANIDGDFLDLGFDGVDLGALAPSLDVTAYTCTHEPLPAVELDGVPL